MRMFCQRKDSLLKVYERYWRWNNGSDTSISCTLKMYTTPENGNEGFKEMITRAIINLIQPHYTFFKSIIETKLK